MYRRHMPDVRDLAQKLEALLGEFAELVTLIPDLSKQSRASALRHLGETIQRLRLIEASVAPDARIDSLVSAAGNLVATLPEVERLVDALPRGQRSKLRIALDKSVRALDSFAAKLDPINQPDAEFDPANPDIIGRLIAKAMIGRDQVPLRSLEDREFYGSGVYAIYYVGSFDAYQLIRRTNHPIYVGKADPENVHATSARLQGRKLWHRLARDHLKSIDRTNNLDVVDFHCRYLVVRSAWQTTAEDYLIDLFKPVWNNQTKVCSGFGKHGDTASTRGNTVSLWDTLHPGRPWATGGENLVNPKSPEDIKAKIAAHFTEHPPTREVDSDISLLSTSAG